MLPVGSKSKEPEKRLPAGWNRHTARLAEMAIALIAGLWQEKTGCAGQPV